MVHTAWRVFLYGLVAATSPLALTTTLVVLRSGRGRINGMLYAGAFLAASTLVLLLVVGVGFATSLTNEGHPLFQAILALLFGMALLHAAAYVRQHPHQHRPRLAPRRRNRLVEMTDRIDHLGPLQSLGIGIAFGIGGPKRLGITVLVAGTITTAWWAPCWCSTGSSASCSADGAQPLSGGITGSNRSRCSCASDPTRRPAPSRMTPR